MLQLSPQAFLLSSFYLLRVCLVELLSTRSSCLNSQFSCPLSLPSPIFLQSLLRRSAVHLPAPLVETGAADWLPVCLEAFGPGPLLPYLASTPLSSTSYAAAAAAAIALQQQQRGRQDGKAAAAAAIGAGGAAAVLPPGSRFERVRRKVLALGGKRRRTAVPDPDIVSCFL